MDTIIILLATYSNGGKFQEIRKKESPWKLIPSIRIGQITIYSFLDLKDEIPVSKKDRDTFHSEFVSLMEERFIDGEDEFDYKTVDNNEDYDDYSIIDQDLEDKYFDDEEPENIEVEEKT